MARKAGEALGDDAIAVRADRDRARVVGQRGVGGRGQRRRQRGGARAHDHLNARAGERPRIIGRGQLRGLDRPSRARTRRAHEREPRSDRRAVAGGQRPAPADRHFHAREAGLAGDRRQTGLEPRRAQVVDVPRHRASVQAGVAVLALRRGGDPAGARASAVPVWESSINRKTRSPTAAMGTTTIRMKKLGSRVRKLMVPGGPPSVSADLAAL
jgi:hypothetical protein